MDEATEQGGRQVTWRPPSVPAWAAESATTMALEISERYGVPREWLRRLGAMIEEPLRARDEELLENLRTDIEDAERYLVDAETALDQAKDLLAQLELRGQVDDDSPLAAF